MFNPTIQAWIFPANFTESQLSMIVLSAEDNDITLAPEDIIFVSVDENWIQENMQSRENFPVDIFDDFWRRNVYTIFDLENGMNTTFRFGFIPRSLVESIRIKWCIG